MKYLSWILAVACLLVATAAYGQSLDGAKFSISGKALGYAAGGMSLVAADAVSAVQISPKLAVRNDNIILSDPNASSVAAFELGGAQYNLPFDKLLGKTFLDPSKYKFYAVGEAGLVTSSLGQSPAFSAGVGLDYFPQSTPSVVVNLFEARVLNGRVGLGPGKTVTNGVAFSVGLTFK